MVKHQRMNRKGWTWKGEQGKNQRPKTEHQMTIKGRKLKENLWKINAENKKEHLLEAQRNS